MILKVAVPSNRAAVFSFQQHHPHPEPRLYLTRISQLVTRNL